MKISYDDNASIEDYEEDLSGEISRMQRASSKGYDDPRASINLSVDDDLRDHIDDVAEAYECDALFVIGIGGSNLGTVAVHEAINGEYHNDFQEPEAYFADTVDPRALRDLAKQLRRHRSQGDRVVINAVSKSGGTTETIANLEYLLDALKATTDDWSDHVVLTTTNESPLDEFAIKHDVQRLHIPELVGGRYSVFSAVGLFPLSVLGVNTDALLKGARDARENGLQVFEDNGPAQSAAHLFHHHEAGRNIANMFLFARRLESVGKWYRQLMGESIGKEHDRDGNNVYAGMTPTVSIGSTDLHSMAQLYLGGPDDKYHAFVTVEGPDAELPVREEFNALVEDIQGKQFNTVMDAIVTGIQGAFDEEQRPYTTVELGSVDEATIGRFLQFKMMEMMYLGHLLNVNPFNQPNVESYKVITKEELSDD